MRTHSDMMELKKGNDDSWIIYETQVSAIEPYRLVLNMKQIYEILNLPEAQSLCLDDEEDRYKLAQLMVAKSRLFVTGR